ncbi:glutathione peroxidase [Azospira oryzae PS]|uniref:Glutathione peroxidase n=1 Tax=Azospira oryzae (strain ATCC BAA-33 / DSM 13638 / PS) TaxID=640081 RepID=G8QMU5_AZOOP|nr:glutathione peroxidase [Azospira oryzae]AEV24675.1 glutathione peroxidase [Azospira oryzae PS]
MSRLAARVLPALLVLFSLIGTAMPASAADCPPLLQHTFPALQDEKPQPLCQYAGKVLLVVNTASYCGFTNQYDGLEDLYAELKGQGLVVLGFPANDFGQQEPGSNQEIADFCRLTYGVRFPMLAKTSVVGKDANPFYQALAKATGQVPQWNFHKYLIDRSGKTVLSFGSRTTPNDPQLRQAIQRFLAQP